MRSCRSLRRSTNENHLYGNAQLKDQLRWRPVSEKPEKDGLYLCLFEDPNNTPIICFFKKGKWLEWIRDDYYGKTGWMNISDDLPILWLPIPPAPEGETDERKD